MNERKRELAEQAGMTDDKGKEMNERSELIRQQIPNLKLAIEELLERAKTDQRITHAKFLADHWTAALDLLETQLNSTRALLKRIETIGR